MENISSKTGLKKAIELAEAEQIIKFRQLKEQFYPAIESIRPVNLFRNTLNGISSSPCLIDNIIGTALSIATGYFTKRIVVGASVNRVRKLLGSIIQFGVTKVVAEASRKSNAIYVGIGIGGVVLLLAS